MNFKYLLVFGDSNSFGSESLKDGDCDSSQNIYHSYGKFLCDDLNLKYFNFAKSGASNLFISSEIINQLTNFKSISNDEILIIIGWSDPKRIILECPSTIIHINDGVDLNNINTKFSNNVQSFYNFLKTLPFIKETISGLNNYFFNSEYCLHMDSFIKLGCFSLLNNKQIKFLSFPALPELLYNGYKEYIKCCSSNIITSYKIKKILGNEMLVNNFNFLDDFKKYGQSQTMFHLKENAHKQFALFLKNKLNNIAWI